ncbi:MAG TPA: type III pantothenate kinase [Steroidobacter sp.]|nr:type III pantothenate kinase [Steroidobacter sp.]
MILLIDIGNTRIKWARWSAGRMNEQTAIAHANLTAERLRAAMIEGAPRPQRVLASNVGGARVGELTAECVKAEWNIEIEFVQSTASAGGVRNAYPEPEKLGVDRWLAVIAAHAMTPRAACVVSVGTAMTVDAVDASGRHYGGVIVPGPDMMIGSLFRSTSEIARRAEQGAATDSLFADNTRAAVEQGAMHALAALAERAVRTFEEQVGETPEFLLTGGAGPRIARALHVPYKLVPDMVLQGLAVLAC